MSPYVRRSGFIGHIASKESVYPEHAWIGVLMAYL